MNKTRLHSRCKWSSGIGLVTFRLRFESHCGSFAFAGEEGGGFTAALTQTHDWITKEGHVDRGGTKRKGWKGEIKGGVGRQKKAEETST